MGDNNVIYNDRLIYVGVGVTADYDINTPCGIKLGRKLFILLEADVREKNGGVNVDGVIGVADTPDLLGGFVGVYEGADDLIFLVWERTSSVRMPMKSIFMPSISTM